MLSEIKRGHLIVAALMLAILFGAGARYGQYLERKSLSEAAVIPAEVGMEESGAAEAGITAGKSPESGEVTVHVAGAVFNPGVFTLKEGSRVNDSIKMAGARPEADLDALNLAKKLTDGERILVPVKKTAGQGGAAPLAGISGDGSGSAGGTDSSGYSSGDAGGLININSASAGELEALPGIGPAKAEALVKFREENGPFASVEDVDKVPGIGPATLNNIKDKISF